MENEEEYKMLKLDGFEDCFVGIVERFGMEPICCYDKTKIVSKLMEVEKMSFEEAFEHFEYNIIGAWMGEGTPCFIGSITIDELD